MALSREAVMWGFRFILGREPESEAVIAAHCAARDHEHLARLLMRSTEFTSSRRFTDLLTARAEGGEAPPLPGAHLSTSSARLLVLGNCQIRPMARLIQAMTGGALATTIELLPKNIERFRTEKPALAELIGASDLILMQPYPEEMEFIAEAFPGARQKIRLFPRIGFAGFHPDADYVEDSHGGRIGGCVGQYHSALAFFGWTRGLSPEQTAGLFRDEVFAALGYYEYWSTAREVLLAEGARAGLPLDELTERWSRTGIWVYTMNHPKLYVLADLAHALLAREGIETIAGAGEFVADEFALRGVWPVYPEIAQRLSQQGHYRFKPPQGDLSPGQPVVMLGLEQFIRGSFEVYAKHSDGALHCARLESARYQALDARLTGVRSAAGPAGQRGHRANSPGAPRKPPHPFEGPPDHHLCPPPCEPTGST